MTDSLPPSGLHSLEYARGLLEDVLAWPPIKTNLELVEACLSSLCRAKNLSGPQAYAYLRRAISLAKQQGIAVDRFFFAEGKYTEVRPQKESSAPPVYKRIDRDALDREQSTPEWQAANDELRAVLAKWSRKAARL